MKWIRSKTIWAGIGLLGLALYQLTQGQLEAAWQSLATALGLLGLRHAIDKESPHGVIAEEKYVEDVLPGTSLGDSSRDVVRTITFRERARP